jgi:protein CpxP
MTLKSTVFRSVLAVSSVAALAGFAYGAGAHCRSGRGGDPEQFRRFITRRVNDILDDLEATDAQRARVLAVKDRILAAARAAHPGHHHSKDELLAQWRSENPDKARVRELIDARVEAMRQAFYDVAEGMLEVHAALTPAQRAQLATELEKHHANHRH